MVNSDQTNSEISNYRKTHSKSLKKKNSLLKNSILNFTFSDFGINVGIHVALNNCACVLAYNFWPLTMCPLNIAFKTYSPESNSFGSAQKATFYRSPPQYSPSQPDINRDKPPLQWPSLPSASFEGILKSKCCQCSWPAKPSAVFLG